MSNVRCGGVREFDGVSVTDLVVAVLGREVFTKCTKENFGYGAGHVARERGRIPGDIAGSGPGFGRCSKICP